MHRLATKITAIALVAAVALGDGGQTPRSIETDDRIRGTHAPA